MPYIEDLEEHDYPNAFETDFDWDQKIWRYMNIEQFISLMNRSALRFSKAGLFTDDFEGLPPSSEGIPSNIEPIIRRQMEMTNISCWHMAPDESATMWGVYSDRAVVIESTIQDFRRSFCDERQFAIHFAEVQYLDYTNESHDYVEQTKEGSSGNLIEAFQFKQEYYQGEREFRAITNPLATQELQEELDGETFDYDEIVEEYAVPGIFVEVNLPELVESVRLSPDSSTRDHQAVKKVAERKHGMGEIVRPSGIQFDMMMRRIHRAE